MPNVHTLTTTYKSEGGSVTINQSVMSGDFSANGEYQIPPGAEDVEIDFPMDADNVLAFAFGCSKAAGTGTFTGLTLKFNSTTVPDATWEITPTNGIAWGYDGGVTQTPPPLGLGEDFSPLLFNVTKIYVSNSGSIAANLVIRYLIDTKH